MTPLSVFIAALPIQFTGRSILLAGGGTHGEITPTFRVQIFLPVTFIELKQFSHEDGFATD